MTTNQGARHWLAFAASGGIAFAIDAVVLESLTLFAGFSPFSARLIAIAAAMLGGWLAHRTWTFRVAAKPSLAEFGRYAAVASGSDGTSVSRRGLPSPSTTQALVDSRATSRPA